MLIKILIVVMILAILLNFTGRILAVASDGVLVVVAAFVVWQAMKNRKR